MKPIRVETAFIPKEICKAHNPICVLVDAIRASCTIITLFEKNFKRILITDDEGKALSNDKAFPRTEYCICAEKEEGTKSDMADVSPSLLDLQRFPDGNGRKVVFRTTNGTVGVRAINSMGVRDIYIGSMLNMNAVAEVVTEHAAATGTGVCIVGAGRENGQIYCIDDTYCCAALIKSIICYVDKKGYALDLQDSAKIALSMAKDYANAEDAFSKSATGEVMRKARSEEDIVLCARDNISTVVPKVTGIDQYGHVIIDAC